MIKIIDNKIHKISGIIIFFIAVFPNEVIMSKWGTKKFIIRILSIIPPLNGIINLKVIVKSAEKIAYIICPIAVIGEVLLSGSRKIDEKINGPLHTAYIAYSILNPFNFPIIQDKIKIVDIYIIGIFHLIAFL